MDRYIGPIACAVAVWLNLVLGFGVWYVWCYESKYFRWGPGNDVLFVGFAVDTWVKWAAVTAIAAVSQLLYMLATETISPWIMNTVMDQKTTTIVMYSYSEVLLCEMCCAVVCVS